MTTLELLVSLYGHTVGRATDERLSAILDHYRASSTGGQARLTAQDAVLITYGDMVQSPGALPLHTLAEFCERHLSGLVSGIHILPFYPYSSDDGFSVIDYRAVDPALGNWEHIAQLGKHFRLMFDAVVNHISAESEWFQRFLQDDPRYRDYFLAVPPGTDLTSVVRPRALPLVTPFSTPSGEKLVWTTFSADQIDLNYHNPDVLLEIIDLLLFYVAHGAEFIRLDAIAFLWKEFGTGCVHLAQTHRIVQLFRAVLDEVAPQVQLVTETNVPHRDNVSYFGDGTDEAQMVYNFALPPLVMHTFRSGNASVLSQWAGTLNLPSDQTTFFNFLASHDGIGLNPVRGILADSDIDALVERTLAHGGRVSYKGNPDGTTSSYELNINYFDALSPAGAGEAIELQVGRFLTAQAIMLSLVGVPGIYFHSLFGSRGWPEGVAATGQNRTINRAKCDRVTLESEVADPESRRHRVFSGYRALLRARREQAAFDPHGTMKVLDAGNSIFAVLRIPRDGTRPVLCLHNVTRVPQRVPPEVLRAAGINEQARDLIISRQLNGNQALVLGPYETAWLASR